MSTARKDNHFSHSVKGIMALRCSVKPHLSIYTNCRAEQNRLWQSSPSVWMYRVNSTSKPVQILILSSQTLRPSLEVIVQALFLTLWSKQHSPKQWNRSCLPGTALWQTESLLEEGARGGQHGQTDVWGVSSGSFTSRENSSIGEICVI